MTARFFYETERTTFYVRDIRRGSEGRGDRIGERAMASCAARDDAERIVDALNRTEAAEQRP